MKTSSRVIAFLTLLFVAATNHSAWACAACWGDTSGSKMSKAAAVGIGAMVVIMFIMLGSIAAFGWHLAWRAKHPLPDYDELLADDTTPDDPEDKS
jgi:predicted branched-subunit amino acid permease